LEKSSLITNSFGVTGYIEIYDMEPLSVPGNLDSLSAIANYVLAAAAAAGLDKKSTYNLRLAVDEIATNIISYGYEAAGREGVVDLRADIDDRTLKICLEDTAEAFDPHGKLSVEEERLLVPIEQRPIGGLGVYLAIQSVDRFSYERIGNRNRNILIVNRSA
jgi:serine/threonine-protein kinase RsbW